MTGEKVFCGDCGNNFIDKKTLGSHVRQVHTVKEVICQNILPKPRQEATFF